MPLFLLYFIILIHIVPKP